MSEWWTYRPSDFLMFAPRTYWRLFELHNQAWWPMPWLLVLLGVVALVAAWRWPGAARRWGMVALAAAWAFCGWAFVLERYAPINWAATGFALGFGLQALVLGLLGAMGLDRGRTRPVPLRAGWRGRVAMALGLWAVLAHPLLAPALGRPWGQAEVLGLAPDPTAIATLAALLAWPVPAQAWRGGRLVQALAWVLTLAWCAVSAATLATMGSVQALVPLAAGLVALPVAVAGRGARLTPPRSAG